MTVRDVTEPAGVAAGVVSDELVEAVVSDASAGGVDLLGSDRSLAGCFVFCLVGGYVRVGCFHYIWRLSPGWGLGDGGFVPGAGVGSDGGEGSGL